MQRRYAFEHKDLLDREDPDEDAGDKTTPSTPDMTQLPSLTPESGSAILPNDSYIGTPTPAMKKRKRGGQVGKGQDFWSQLELWFKSARANWGDKWSSPGWHA